MPVAAGFSPESGEETFLIRFLDYAIGRHTATHFVPRTKSMVLQEREGLTPRKKKTDDRQQRRDRLVAIVCVCVCFSLLHFPTAHYYHFLNGRRPNNQEKNMRRKKEPNDRVKKTSRERFLILVPV